MSSDLIPVPRQQIERLLERLQDTGYGASDPRVRMLHGMLADPPSGSWLSGEEVETLRKWRDAGAAMTSDEHRAFFNTLDRILAACPEPEQFSDEECRTFARLMGFANSNNAEVGRRHLANLAAAGLYVAPRTPSEDR